MNTLDKVYDLTIDIKNIDVKYNSYAKFFDDDRETSVIRIKLLNDKTPIDLEGCTVEAEFILANNTYHDETCKIINSSEGVVELQLCQKCLVKGENIVRLSILKDNEISNTPVITYEVRKGLYSDNPNFNDDPLTPILSQMLLDIKVTKVNQIELQERYEKVFPQIQSKINEVDDRLIKIDEAIASGTQDLEVKEARDGEVSLKARLDRDIEKANKELDRVKKLEESTVSTVETESDFTTVEATSNVFSITVSGSSSGGSDSGSGGGDSTVNDEYALSCTSDYILDKMYPMGQSHEAIPSGNITGWKYNSRWENQDRPYAMSHSCGQSGCPGTGAFQALGCWSNIYRVEGAPFTQNTAVEMKDIKVYGWYSGAWELVQHLPVPNGNFYAESFGGDINKYFADSVKQTSTSKTIILREANKINSENCMYHPFSNIKAFDTKYQYIYTCIDLRKVKWDENGVDDRDQTHYCSNCGGDWWLKEGLTFHDSWQHNKGVCQPKFIEITNEWRRFSMTTVPQGWSQGFPV